MPFLPPAIVDTQKPAAPTVQKVQSDGPSIAERILIFKVCALLGIPLREIGVVKERNNMPVLLVDAEMSEQLAQRLSVGFKGVYPELGVIDSKGHKFLFSEGPE